jgi:hypothetical protein
MNQIDNGFGGKDETLMQEQAIFLIGEVSKLERLMQLWKNSYPCGTKLDFLYGRGRTKEQIFERKAKTEGFTDKQIECFYEL